MPGADGRIADAPPQTAAYRALIALDLGLHLCVDLIRTIGEMHTPAIYVDTAALHKALDEIRASSADGVADARGGEPQ